MASFSSITRRACKYLTKLIIYFCANSLSCVVIFSSLSNVENVALTLSAITASCVVLATRTSVSKLVIVKMRMVTLLVALSETPYIWPSDVGMTVRGSTTSAAQLSPLVLRNHLLPFHLLPFRYQYLLLGHPSPLIPLTLVRHSTPRLPHSTFLTLLRVFAIPTSSLLV